MSTCARDALTLPLRRVNSPGLSAGVTQLVECQLPKLNVDGSNPFARFRKG